jgi:hypothetical protein
MKNRRISRIGSLENALTLLILHKASTVPGIITLCRVSSDCSWGTLIGFGGIASGIPSALFNYPFGVVLDLLLPGLLHPPNENVAVRRGENLIDETAEFWEARSGQAINREDARQIVENVTGFFRLLQMWQAQEREVTIRLQPVCSSSTVVDSYDSSGGSGDAT